MVSGIIASVLMALFVIGWIWAWSPRREREFDEASRLALEDSSAGQQDEQP